FFSSRRRHTRFSRDWSSDVCSSDLDNGFFGAKQVLSISASSKTGLGLGYSLHQRRPSGPAVIGLTSARNKGFVEGLGFYDKVVRSEERRVGQERRAVWGWVDASHNT